MVRDDETERRGSYNIGSAGGVEADLEIKSLDGEEDNGPQ